MGWYELWIGDVEGGLCAAWTGIIVVLRKTEFELWDSQIWPDLVPRPVKDTGRHSVRGRGASR